MKIGIVTMWNTVDNYGGILQTFALQKYLRDLGYDAFDIRFSPRFGLKHEVKAHVKKVFIAFHLYKDKGVTAILNAKCRRFDVFRKKYIALSEREYHSMNDIQKNYPEADIYITGSDQVWARPILDGKSMEKIFYLDFGRVETKRIAYAVSFGHSTFPCVDEMEFKRLVNRFDKVSVREENGLKICAEFGIQANRCLDSTLLLDPKVYKDIMAPRKHQGDYAFFYTVNVSSPSEIFWPQLRDFLNSINIMSIVTTASGYKPAEEIFDGAIYDYATVEEWLANIYYSKIVVTASFHGVVFAILLQKDFIYIPLKGKFSTGNDRIVDLLSAYGLSDRIALSLDKAFVLVDKHIDFKSLDNEEILRLISISKEFLFF